MSSYTSIFSFLWYTQFYLQLMILGNVSIYNTNWHRQIGAFGDRMTNYKPSTWNNSYSPDTTTTSQMSRASYPTGTQPPYSWLLAPKWWEMSATTTIWGSGAVVWAMSMGKTCTADLSGSGALVWSMALVSSMLATLSGTGGITANLSATISMIASLAWSGSLAGSLGLRIPLSANLSGSGTITANLKGNADMSAHIYVNSGSATTQELVDAIWNALASSYNVAGTMGEAVQTGGGWGGWWLTPTQDANLTKASKALTLPQFIALQNP